MSTTQRNALDTIAKHESNWRNVLTKAWNPTTGFNQSTGTVTGPSTASGYWQITNTTWRGYAPGAGVDVSKYPTAMSAPYGVQRQVASSIYQKRGFADWAPYNASLRADIARSGGARAFAGDDVVPSNSPVSGGDGATDMRAQRTGADYVPQGQSTDGSPGMDGTTPADTDGSPGMDATGAQTDYLRKTLPDDSEGIATGVTAGRQGVGSTVPQAIVTAANQESTAIASAAKAEAAAALKAAETTTKSDATLQQKAQSWGSNWITRIFLFIVGAIFIGGGLLLFGGQSVAGVLKK